MRIECWIRKPTNTHSEYVILIAFPLQQWLNQSASIIRYTIIDLLVVTEMDIVSCTVRTEYLYTIQIYSLLSMVSRYGIRYFLRRKLSDVSLQRCRNICSSIVRCTNLNE